MELIVVMGILLLISGFVAINLVNQQRTSSLNSSVDVLIADIASQQTKAMSGVGGQWESTSNYGIYFEPDRYILFQGTNFLATDSANFTVMLDKNIEFSNITFPGNIIVFSALSGEIMGFSDSNNTITIQDSAGSENKTITVNRYGVVESIN